MSDMHTTTPWALSHEQRILAALEDIKHEMVLARLERWGNVNKPPVDPPKPGKRK